MGKERKQDNGLWTSEESPPRCFELLSRVSSASVHLQFCTRHIPKGVSRMVHLLPYKSSLRWAPNASSTPCQTAAGDFSLTLPPLCSRAVGLGSLPPGTIQEFDLCQSLRDHGSKNKAKEDTADQNVVIVIFQDIKLFGWVDSSLVNVQTIGHHQTGGLQAWGRGVDTSHSRNCLVIVDESLRVYLDIWRIRD